jgi:hypothetical protein
MLLELAVEVPLQFLQSMWRRRPVVAFVQRQGAYEAAVHHRFRDST